MLAGCTREARLVASDQPQTPPTGPHDPRAERYEGNFYQVSQGGRYFSWYGCEACHGNSARPTLDLAGPGRRRTATLRDTYAAIATGHPAPISRYADKIPVEQLWQISAFVQDLGKNDPSRNRRNSLDQRGEPQGDTWQGPVL